MFFASKYIDVEVLSSNIIQVIFIYAPIYTLLEFGNFC